MRCERVNAWHFGPQHVWFLPLGNHSSILYLISPIKYNLIWLKLKTVKWQSNVLSKAFMLWKYLIQAQSTFLPCISVDNLDDFSTSVNEAKLKLKLFSKKFR